MFIDEAKISVSAGKGGDGAVSFRHEKYVEFGGPDGGDGGKGGSVIVKADSHVNDLSEFNRKRSYRARDGEPGKGKKLHGKNADDLILKVPLGTQIFEIDKFVADLTEENESVIVAKGGNGGWGNQHFATSKKQAPRWSKQGLSGEGKKLRLELKTIADVGLVGLPNAGKSTLLSVLTNAKPKIADYQFTTLEPNLGALKKKGKTTIIADIPGLIEGASKGKGLGDKFLRHVERTKKLLHVIDANSDNLIRDYNTIRKELEDFSIKLSKKEEILVLNKIDTVVPNELKQKILELKSKNIRPLLISAVTKENLDSLISLI